MCSKNLVITGPFLLPMLRMSQYLAKLFCFWFPINLVPRTSPWLLAQPRSQGRGPGNEVDLPSREKNRRNSRNVTSILNRVDKGLILNVMKRCGPKEVKINLDNNIQISRQLIRYDGVQGCNSITGCHCSKGELSRTLMISVH